MTKLPNPKRCFLVEHRPDPERSTVWSGTINGCHYRYWKHRDHWHVQQLATDQHHETYWVELSGESVRYMADAQMLAVRGIAAVLLRSTP